MDTIDEDVELIVPDTVEEAVVGVIFPDFSQVQIQVHGSDVAEKIIKNIEYTEEEVFSTEEYVNGDIEVDILEISDDNVVHIEEESETVAVDCNDKYQTDRIHNQDADSQKYGDVQEYIAITGSDSYQEDDFDNVERIADKDISNYDAVIEEYPDYANVAVKEEMEAFTGTDYTDFDAGMIEEHNSDDLPPEDIYHCNNVIILGSKPCPSNPRGILRRLLTERDSEEETGEVKKEHLDAVVVLEDWGPNLERSDSFCEECGTLFVTPNELGAHKMTAHSFLVPVIKNVAIKSTTKPAFARKSTGAVVVKTSKNLARKSTGNKSMGPTFCNHCNKVFSDHTTLIKHLYELLPLKQFTCNICNIMFQTQKELTEHNSIHDKPEKVKVKNEKIDKAVASKRKLEEVKKQPVSPKEELEAIPKSILFQCPKCSIYFSSVLVGYRHFLNCTISNKRKPAKCYICKRKMHSNSLDIHKKQHKLSSKFQIQKVHKNLAERTLCKCPNCEIHFTDFSINLHLKDCGKTASMRCLKCNILVQKCRYHTHLKMHTQQNLKPKDFLVIEHAIIYKSISGSSKRKLEPPNTPTKRIKLEHSQSETTKALQRAKIKKEVEKPVPKVNKMLANTGLEFRFYFCVFCKSCCSSHSYRDIHLKKQCMTSSYRATRVICPTCGLQFNKASMKYHRTLHRKNLSIHKVAFVNLHTMKRIIPSVPNYPQCSDCKIKFFDPRVLEDHICGEDYETCQKCGEKYHITAYNIHLEFHNLGEPRRASKKETQLIPELIKKYESLNMMWNIVYCCKTCDIITDQYDKAVEHSQGHFNQELTTKNIKCYICNLKFDESCWSKHSELHSQMNISSKEFKILTYSPRKLLTEDWFEMFHSLPKEQITQVTEQSVYGCERRFKMKLLKEGRPEFTVYCCHECKVACRNNEIEKHIHSTCRSSTNICKLCRIPFSDISTLRNHQILHLKGVKKEEFRVVVFTKQKTVEVQTTKNKPKIKQKPRFVTKKIKNSFITTNKAGKKSYKGIEVIKGKYVLYRCRNCQSCIHFQRNIMKHNCSLKCTRKKCIYCHELINSKNMILHIQRHQETPDFNLDNFVVNIFDPNNIGSESNVDFEPVKKKPKTNSQKVTNKTTSANNSKLKMSPTKAKAKTSRTSLTKNKSKAKSAPTKSKPDLLNVPTEKKAIIYKCECGLHYTSLKNIEKHSQTCKTESETEISKENCSKCGLLFPTDVLVSHLCKHHCKNSKFTVELYQKESDVDVEKVESTSKALIKKDFECRVKLFKCSECNICFVNKNTCYKHVYKNHKPIKSQQGIECKLCGLQFTVYSLSSHVSRHHSNYLSHNDILIQEYYPAVGKGPPKSHFYLVSDKVQSLQVTSSIDDVS